MKIKKWLHELDLIKSVIETMDEHIGSEYLGPILIKEKLLELAEEDFK